MFAVVRWTFFLVFWAVVAGFLYYTLPQRDVVQVSGTEIIRQDFSGWNRIFYAQADAGNAETINRDLRLINTVRRNGRVMVYRNEDTGFGWPPYFKLDSSNLQAEAQNASRQNDEQWYAITHYGIRSEFLTIYPNATNLSPVDSADVRLIPWFNIVFLTVLLAFVWGIWVRLKRFRENRIDPLFEDA
ncbi:MAG: DUF1523 family protein [Pseudomonadota bacterium]